MNARLVSVEEPDSGRVMATMLGALEKACQPGTASANSPHFGGLIRNASKRLGKKG